MVLSAGGWMLRGVALLTMTALVTPLGLRAGQGTPSGAIRGRLDIRRLVSLPRPRPQAGDSASRQPRGVPDVRRGLVYLDVAPRGAFDAGEPGRAVMDQRQETFVPRLVAVQAGSSVDFPNSDSTFHNVFSLSRTRRFDLGRYAAGRSKAVRFDRSGVVRVFCDIHSHMSAFVVVFSHPYFRVTDADGRFRLEHVPPGTYTVVGWYEGEARTQRSVTVTAGGVTDVELVVPMIPGLASLRSRIFLAGTLLATASIGSAVYFVSVLLTAQAEAELQRDLSGAVTLVDQQSTTLFESVARTATLIADLPKFKAALETRDPPTITPIARDYLEQAGADLVVVADRDGQRLAAVSADADALGAPGWPGAPEATLPPGDRPGATFWPHPNGVLQLVTVAVTIDRDRPEQLGLLTMGFLLDVPRAGELRRLTGADIAFALDGQVRATSLPPVAVSAVTAWLNQQPRPAVLRLGGDDYSALASPLATTDGRGDSRVSPHAIVLRSRSERVRTLSTIRAALGGVALATVALAAVLSYSLSRTVTRPLATITAHMRDAAATGDLTGKVTLADSAWTDEDAALVAATYNTLTESVAAAQRDAAQRERLSALGRLSTVIAHEVRNPLMIIKGALRQLKRSGVSVADTRDAAHDIDEEVDRLNRVVNEVLDFARPIRFDCAPADVNEICRSAADAIMAAAAVPAITLDLDPLAGLLTTDAERVRTVLVNLLANARAAVDGRDTDAAALVILQSRRYHRLVRLTVRDRGVGIPADDISRVFDPYFTTRRTGNGLGLAIAKNVIEGLGGTIAVSSRVEAGTEMTIELGDTPERRS